MVTVLPLTLTWRLVTGMTMAGPEAGLITMLPLPLRTGSLKVRSRSSLAGTPLWPFGGLNAGRPRTESQPTVGAVVSALLA